MNFRMVFFVKFTNINFFDLLHFETQKFLSLISCIIELAIKLTKETFGSRNAMCSYKHSNISITFIGINHYVYGKFFHQSKFIFTYSIK